MNSAFGALGRRSGTMNSRILSHISQHKHQTQLKKINQKHLLCGMEVMKSALGETVLT